MFLAYHCRYFLLYYFIIKAQVSNFSLVKTHQISWSAKCTLQIIYYDTFSHLQVAAFKNICIENLGMLLGKLRHRLVFLTFGKRFPLKRVYCIFSENFKILISSSASTWLFLIIHSQVKHSS